MWHAASKMYTGEIYWPDYFGTTREKPIGMFGKIGQLTMSEYPHLERMIVWAWLKEDRRQKDLQGYIDAAAKSERIDDWKGIRRDIAMKWFTCVLSTSGGSKRVADEISVQRITREARGAGFFGDFVELDLATADFACFLLWCNLIDQEYPSQELRSYVQQRDFFLQKIQSKQKVFEDEKGEPVTPKTIVCRSAYSLKPYGCGTASPELDRLVGELERFVEVMRQAHPDDWAEIETGKLQLPKKSPDRKDPRCTFLSVIAADCCNWIITTLLEVLEQNSVTVSGEIYDGVLIEKSRAAEAQAFAAELRLRLTDKLVSKGIDAEHADWSVQHIKFKVKELEYPKQLQRGPVRVLQDALLKRKVAAKWKAFDPFDQEETATARMLAVCNAPGADFNFVDSVATGTSGEGVRWMAEKSDGQAREGVFVFDSERAEARCAMQIKTDGSVIASDPALGWFEVKPAGLAKLHSNAIEILFSAKLHDGAHEIYRENDMRR
jgi:hypothetical protein